MNPRDKEFEAKKESNPEFLPPRINSRQWSSSFKNPRIVRVSRSFGGKDRHSKVCTVRGLRDRRIRLSVPTAIQLYDLQDRLGLSQPSKVVDWLIDAAKHDIDKLPPLPIIPSHLIPSSHHSSSSLSNLLVTPSVEPYSKGGTTMKMDVQEEGFGHGGSFVAQNFFPMPNMPYSNPNFFHWDPSNLSLSQFGGGYINSFATQLPEESTSHLYTPSIIPPFIPQPMENDYFRHINNHLQQNPTTLHFIGRPSHENETQKQDNKDT